MHVLDSLENSTFSSKREQRLQCHIETKLYFRLLRLERYFVASSLTFRIVSFSQLRFFASRVRLNASPENWLIFWLGWHLKAGPRANSASTHTVVTNVRWGTFNLGQYRSIRKDSKHKTNLSLVRNCGRKVSNFSEPPRHSASDFDLVSSKVEHVIFHIRWCFCSSTLMLLPA